MSGRLRTVGYYVNWAIYARNFQPQDLQGQYFTHILYSFADVRPESGEVFLTDSWSDVEKHYPSDSWNDQGTNVYGCAKQLYLLKQNNRKMKVMLSIGGWTYSASFAQGTGTQSNRETFAKSAVQILADCGFDGIDVDWEYPKNAEEATAYTELLKTIRAHLDEYSRTHAQGKKFYLTVAAPCGLDKINTMDVRGMNQYLDFWNLMAYDFAGSWDSTAGHQANIFPSHDSPTSTPFSLTAAIGLYKAAGVPAQDLVIGMPLYGRTFTNTDGPGKPYSGTGEGSWENGVWDFKALPKPGATEHVDANILASWSYDPTSKTMVTYDTKQVAQMKAKWILDEGLGGAMWWETSSDKLDDESLVKTVVDMFGGPNSAKLDTEKNTLSYPLSKYDNIKKGMAKSE